MTRALLPLALACGLAAISAAAYAEQAATPVPSAAIGTTEQQMDAYMEPCRVAVRKVIDGDKGWLMRWLPTQTQITTAERFNLQMACTGYILGVADARDQLWRGLGK